MYRESQNDWQTEQENREEYKDRDRKTYTNIAIKPDGGGD